MNGLTLIILRVGDGDDVWFLSEIIKDTSGEGLMYEACTADPTVLGSGLF